jgi:hypothetical protein
MTKNEEEKLYDAIYTAVLYALNQIDYKKLSCFSQWKEYKTQTDR